MRRLTITRLAAVGVLVATAAAGCGGDSSGGGTKHDKNVSAKPTILWPAPPDPLSRTEAAGLTAEVKESLTYHVHAHLDVFVDGKPIIVPAGIGIDIDDPEVKSFTDTPDGSTGYGGIERCKKPCISPLHTHDDTGILHTESSTPDPNTLGQFFTEWGVDISSSCVADICDKPIAFYVDGEKYTRDPSAIQLTYQEEIALVIGDPPAQIPRTADFSNA